MRCKYCGGEINLSVYRCIGCGRAVDDTADVRILHDLNTLVEKYGLDPGSDKYDVVMERGDDFFLDQRTSADPLPLDLKSAVVPGIKLETYYELMGEGMNYDSDPEQAEIMVGNTDNEDATEVIISDQSDGDTENTSEAVNSEEPVGLRKRLEMILDRIDELTSPVTEKVRVWYNSKMPQLNRAKSSSKWERLAVVGIIAAAAVLVVVMISAIIASIPESIDGEWRIGEENAQSLFTVEFSDGEVIARVYDENGEEHIYKTGTYDTSRKNGRDLLTIEYDDGGLSHLYYEIDGGTGEFVNVDTGKTDSYERID